MYGNILDLKIKPLKKVQVDDVNPSTKRKSLEEKLKTEENGMLFLA